ncbi:hypothetical protein [Candidatus Palauibacter sp.]|uniref:hypothetical protein n=1 Tax=Candidatus Palauibacter sp. TaxID=3101350 RepID=UPI003B5BCCF3
MDLPEDLLERLQQRARENRLTIREVVLAAIEREVERGEFREHLASRPATDPGVKAARLIGEERGRRDGGGD